MVDQVRHHILSFYIHTNHEPEYNGLHFNFPLILTLCKLEFLYYYFCYNDPSDFITSKFIFPVTIIVKTIFGFPIFIYSNFSNYIVQIFYLPGD